MKKLNMEMKKIFLEKYEIPLSHLDFGYIAGCNNSREMEKIVQILRSGEEGHFPDLTRCAEDKLRALKPGSRLFRYEEPIRGRDCLSKSEWKPIYDWTNDIKVKDHKLELASKSDMQNSTVETPLELCLPPIRKGGKITQLTKSDDANGKASNNSTGPANTNTNCKSTECIKSTDYDKWNKYDPDVEILRMDLAEERIVEEVERKNRLNIQRSLQATKKSDETNKTTSDANLAFSVLNDVERENLAEDHRLRGNEYFRVKEYEQAVQEYDRAIQINPQSAAPAYNNRAIAHIKMFKYSEAMSDAETCLGIEPNNLKARLRLAEATYGYGRKRESYDLYLKVLELDADNATALKAIADLRNEFVELPPAGATRLQIHEAKPTNSNVKETKKPKVQKSKPVNKNDDKSKEYDLAQLIVPNRIVKSKLITAAEALTSLNTSEAQRKKPTTNAEQATTNRNAMAVTCGEEEAVILRMPAYTKHAKSVGKMMIEEI